MYSKLIYDFVGTSGCGKTTIMNSVKTTLIDLGRTVNIVESSSRTLLKQFDLKLYDKTSDFTQCFISLINWAEIFDSIMRYDVTLCTDLGIRSLAYTMFSPNNQQTTIDAHSKVVKFFMSEEFASKVMPVWVYIPLEIKMDVNENDAHRGFVDLDAHKWVDKIIRNILFDFDVPHYILTGSKRERADAMDGLVTDFDRFMKPARVKGWHL